MALNRLIDWRLDALNPRTQNRHLPRGLVKPGETLALALLGLLLLVYAGLNLNPLTARLLPVAVFFLVFYSYTKRFTWLCHYVLGLTIGAAAAGVDRRHGELRPHGLRPLGGGGALDRRV